MTSRNKYEEEHKPSFDMRWRCSTCSHLVCFGQVLDESAKRVTRCNENVPIFPVKASKSCKRFSRKQYNGYYY